MKGNLLYILIFILTLNIVFLSQTELDNIVRSNTSYSISDNISLEDKKCIDCHSYVIKENINHPAKLYNCTNCHLTNGKEHPSDTAKGFYMPSVKPTLCYSCHDDVKKINQKTSRIHKEIYNEQSCTNCHSPHANLQSSFFISNDNKTCLNCHSKSYKKRGKFKGNIKSLLEKSKNIHKPIEEGCSNCHNPHASNEQSILAKKFPEGTFTKEKINSFSNCFNCHNNQLVTEKETENATGFRNGSKNLHFFHIYENKARSCITCHDPHATNYRYLIRENFAIANIEMKIKYTLKDNGGSCLTGCHAIKVYKRDPNTLKELSDKENNQFTTGTNSKQIGLSKKDNFANIIFVKATNKVEVKKVEIKKIDVAKVEVKKLQKKDSIKPTIKEVIKPQIISTKIIPEKSDTCYINNFPFELTTYKSMHLLKARVRNEKVEIIKSNGELLKYRVIRFVFTNREDDNSPSIRHFSNRVSYSALQILKNAKIGDKFYIEEIEIANPSKEIFTNSVKPFVLKRIKN